MSKLHKIIHLMFQFSRNEAYHPERANGNIKIERERERGRERERERKENSRLPLTFIMPSTLRITFFSSLPGLFPFGSHCIQMVDKFVGKKDINTLISKTIAKLMHVEEQH